MTHPKYLDLKVPVFINNRTGQLSVVLPKKRLKCNPRIIEVRIPKRFLK